MDLRLKNHAAFTLVELVLAITISAVVFLGVITFVGDTISQLGKSNKSSELIVELDEMVSTLNGLNSAYENKVLLIDGPKGSAGDVLLLSGSGTAGGIVFALVNPQSQKVFTGATEFGLYNAKHMGYKRITSTELSAVMGDSSLAYDYVFQKDKIYSNLYSKEFQVEVFNTGSIVELNLSLLLTYDTDKQGLLWKELGTDSIYNIHLNF